MLSNQVLLGGHVEIGDHVMIGGATAVHPECAHWRAGLYRGPFCVEGDVMHFALAGGNRAHIFGLNLVGLKRRGFDAARLASLRAAYDVIFGGDDTRVLSERVEQLAASFSGNADVADMLTFLRGPTTRPLCAPRAKRGA